MKRRVWSSWFFWGVVLLTFLCDQGTKTWVRQNLSLYESWAPIPSLAKVVTFTHVTNTGVAFGLFQGKGDLFLYLSLLVVLVLFSYLHLISVQDRWSTLALGLQVGGALGNLTDRLLFGHVTDFIDFHFWPVFNVADSALTVGTAILLLMLTLEERRERRAAREQPASAATPSSEGKPRA